MQALTNLAPDVNPTHLSAPDIITRGVIAPEHVRQLFKTYVW